MAKIGVIFEPKENFTPPSVIGQKFRELNSDSVQFVLQDHTPELRHLVTVTSKLPVPRKGNPGTVKSTIHILKDVSIRNPDQTSKVVPVITKIETSYPVGTSVIALQNEMLLAGSVALDHVVFEDLFSKGILVDVRN